MAALKVAEFDNQIIWFIFQLMILNDKKSYFKMQNTSTVHYFHGTEKTQLIHELQLVTGSVNNKAEKEELWNENRFPSKHWSSIDHVLTLFLWPHIYLIPPLAS